MELTKEHRGALIDELDKAQQDAKIQQACIDKRKDNLANWFEISLFLAEERIKLIKKALTDNEIYY